MRGFAATVAINCKTPFHSMLSEEHFLLLLLLFLVLLLLGQQRTTGGNSGWGEHVGRCRAHVRLPCCGAKARGGAARRLFEEPWWAAYLGKKDAAWWLRVIDCEALRALPGRVCVGFLNAASDLQRHMGHALKPYLPEVTAIVACLLDIASRPGNFSLPSRPAQPGAQPPPGEGPPAGPAPPSAAPGPSDADHMAHVAWEAQLDDAAAPLKAKEAGTGLSTGFHVLQRGSSESHVDLLQGPRAEKSASGNHERTSKGRRKRPRGGQSTKGGPVSYGVPGRGGAVPSEEEAGEEKIESGGAVLGTDDAREVRTSAARLLAELWGRFPGDCDYNPVWAPFFAAAGRLAPRMAVEVRSLNGWEIWNMPTWHALAGGNMLTWHGRSLVETLLSSVRV